MGRFSRVAYLAGRGRLWLSQAGFPVAWPPVGIEDMARRRRRAGRTGVLARWPVLLRPLAWLAMFPGWAFGAWRSSTGLVRAHPALATHPGRRQIWSAALKYNFQPREVVEYGLLETGSNAPDLWFCEHEMFGIWEKLTPQATRMFAADKRAFAGFCADANLPHAETLAIWDNGIVQSLPVEWPAAIALKPAAANNAQGFEAWVERDGRYYREDLSLSPAEFADHGAALSRHWGVMLAQPLLELHADLAARGLTGMPVARLITGLWPTGEITLCDAYFSAPSVGAYASNASFGPKWPVDIASGQIEPSQSRLLPRWQGQPLEGTRLPIWAEAVAAVQRGHERFAHKAPVLGWDVAFAAQGPVLLEANTGISFVVPQGTRRRPVGGDPIARLVDAWLTTE